MKLYKVTLDGCDDATYFDMALTEEQHEFLQKVAALSKEHSNYGCMPRMSVEEKTVYIF